MPVPIIGQIKTFTHLDGNTAHDPVFDMLRDCLCRQIPLDKDFEDVSPILLIKDVVHTGFKLRERCEAIKDTLTNPVSGFVVMRVPGRGRRSKEDKRFILENLG
jgi:hypothetical protein